MKTVIPGVCIGGEAKMRSFAAPSSPFKVTDNDNLQGVLENLAYNCFTHYQLIDRGLMQALYGVPVASSQKIRRPPPARIAMAPFDPDDVPDVFKSILRNEPSLDVPPRARRPAAQPGVDACDVVGPLSDHAALVQIFLQGVDNDVRKQADQFHLRFSEEGPEY